MDSFLLFKEKVRMIRKSKKGWVGPARLFQGWAVNISFKYIEFKGLDDPSINLVKPSPDYK